MESKLACLAAKPWNCSGSRQQPRSLLQAFEQLYLAGVVHIVRCHAVEEEVGQIVSLPGEAEKV